VESVDGAQVSTTSAMDVPIHSNDQDVSQNSTGPQCPDETQAMEPAPLIVNSTSTSTAILAPVNSGPTANSTSTFIADPLAHVSSDPAIISTSTPSVVNLPASLGLEGTETQPQFTSAMNSIGKLSVSGVPGDQSIGELTRDTSYGDSDVIMADDTDLPAYLAVMIGYLCGVTADEAWQDLVTHFVALEKAGHVASGVSAV